MISSPLLLDCTAFHPSCSAGGVSVYKQEVFRRLNPEIRLHAFYRKIEPDILTTCGQSISGDSLIRGNMLTWRDQAIRNFRRNGARAVWFPTQFASWLPILPSVATIHDMAALLAWRSFSPMGRAYMPATLFATCRNANILMVVSEATEADLHRLFPWTRKKTVVARHGLPSDARSLSEEIENRMHPVNGPIRLLFLDGANTRKRLDLSLLDLEIRGWSNFELTITGNPSAVRQRILKVLGRVPEQIKLVGRLERSLLLKTIASSDLLLYPSDFEGFGFPLIEAMAFGTSVVSFPGNAEKEVGGQCALFAEQPDQASLGRAIDIALERIRDVSWQQKLVRHGQSFTWNNSINVHNKILGELIS
jgi:glycosyltransferase involved in cell wall biosynthesis